MDWANLEKLGKGLRLAGNASLVLDVLSTAFELIEAFSGAPTDTDLIRKDFKNLDEEVYRVRLEQAVQRAELPRALTYSLLLQDIDTQIGLIDAATDSLDAGVAVETMMIGLPGLVNAANRLHQICTATGSISGSLFEAIREVTFNDQVLTSKVSLLLISQIAKAQMAYVRVLSKHYANPANAQVFETDFQTFLKADRARQKRPLDVAVAASIKRFSYMVGCAQTAGKAISTSTSDKPIDTFARQ